MAAPIIGEYVQKPAVRAFAYSIGDGVALPGVMRETECPAGFGVLAVQGVGTIHVKAGDYLLVGASGRPYARMRREEFERRYQPYNAGTHRMK